MEARIASWCYYEISTFLIALLSFAYSASFLKDSIIFDNLAKEFPFHQNVKRYEKKTQAQ
jgi:hypothetical protein